MSGQLIRNGIPYGTGPGGVATNAFLADLTTKDGDSNIITETYATKQELSDYMDRQALITGAAAVHNAVFRGKDITAYYTDGSLYDRIQNGFDDLWIGDYFKASYQDLLSSPIKSVEVTFRIAAFNYDRFLASVKSNHAIIMPDESLGASSMNDTHTAEGGYKGSKLRTTIIPKIITSIRNILGSKHFLQTREYLTTTVDTSMSSDGYRGWNGFVTGGEWSDSWADLCSEYEVYGTPVWMSNPRFEHLGAFGQYPLFKLAPSYINPLRYIWWLRTVISFSGYARASFAGNAGMEDASIDAEIRPRFMIG